MIIVCDSEVKVDLSPLYVHDVIDTEVELCLFYLEDLGQYTSEECVSVFLCLSLPILPDR